MGALLPWLWAVGGLAAGLAVHGPGLSMVPADRALVVTGWPLETPRTEIGGATALWLPGAQRASVVPLGQREVRLELAGQLGDGSRVVVTPVYLQYRVKAEDVRPLSAGAGASDPAAWDARASALLAQRLSAHLATVPGVLAVAADPEGLLGPVARTVQSALVAAGFRVDDLRWGPPHVQGAPGEALARLGALEDASARLRLRTEGARARIAAARAAVQAAHANADAAAERARTEALDATEAALDHTRTQTALNVEARLAAARTALALAPVQAEALRVGGAEHVRGVAARVRGLGPQGDRVARYAEARRRARRVEPEPTPTPALIPIRFPEPADPAPAPAPEPTPSPERAAPAPAPDPAAPAPAPDPAAPAPAPDPAAPAPASGGAP